VRSPLFLTLVFCAGMLPTLSAVAAEQAPTHAPSARSGRGKKPPVHRGGVAVLRRVSRPSVGAAGRYGHSPAMAKVQPKDEAQAPGADDKAKSQLATVDASVQTHQVKRGETLQHLAAQYATSATVLIALNGLNSDESIRQGQILFVPSHEKPLATRSATWRRYAKLPKEKGHVDLSTSTAHFAGSVVDRHGDLVPAAVQAINNLLGAGGKHPPLPERLIRLLVNVSETFGGRSIRVVSGYRTTSYYQDSRHRLSAAIDFSMADVPNAVLCEYLRDVVNVGVGYYPNSTFVHLDVRKQSFYWVDYAGPGEPPRSSPNAPRTPHGSKRWLLAELDKLVNQTKNALERTGNESLSDIPAPTVPQLASLPSDPAQPPTFGDAVASSRDSAEPISM